MRMVTLYEGGGSCQGRNCTALNKPTSTGNRRGAAQRFRSIAQ
jgi:hypothetical protein